MLYIAGIYDSKTKKSNTWAVSDELALMLEGTKIENLKHTSSLSTCEVTVEGYKHAVHIPLRFIKEDIRKN